VISYSRLDERRDEVGKVTRKRYGAEFKAKVALEAIKGEQTLAELAAKHGIHQTMIAAWKRQAIEGLTSTFSGKAEPVQATSEAELSRLHAKIGQLVVERDFLAKASGRRASNGGGRRSTRSTSACRSFGNARCCRSAGPAIIIGRWARAKPCSA
jgi:transposase